MSTITLVGLYLTLAIPAAMAQIQPETIGTETMADPAENWFISKTSNGAYVWDGTTGEMQGMLSLAGSNTPAVQPYGPRREIYAAEMYYSRGVHGDRTDVVTVYDFDNLSPIAEIEIPKKIAVIPLRRHIGITGNGKYLSVFNMTPAQSVSIIDVEKRSFVAEISTAGCAVIMPVADNDFLMLCGDGSIQLIQLDDRGKESNRIRSEPFFIVEGDPVYERPVATEEGWFLLTYGGRAFSVSTHGTQIRIGEPWFITTEDDRAEQWLPGGNQLKTVHKGLGLLYVLMHQGVEYTHHEPGSEIWVVDINVQRRIARIKLNVRGSNVMVTQEREPKLIVSDIEGGLHVYDALKMTLDRTITDPGPVADLLEDF